MFLEDRTQMAIYKTDSRRYDICLSVILKDEKRKKQRYPEYYKWPSTMRTTLFLYLWLKFSSFLHWIPVKRPGTFQNIIPLANANKNNWIQIFLLYCITYMIIHVPVVNGARSWKLLLFVYFVMRVVVVAVIVIVVIGHARDCCAVPRQ